MQRQLGLRLPARVHALQAFAQAEKGARNAFPYLIHSNNAPSSQATANPPQHRNNTAPGLPTRQPLDSLPYGPSRAERTAQPEACLAASAGH